MLRLTLPVVPSVNHCYRNVSIHRRILTKAGASWQQQAQAIATNEARKQHWQYSVNEKLVMELKAYWPDRRRRDMSNMHKLLPDTLEKVLYDDDKWLLIRDIDFEVDRQNPRVEIVLYRLEEGEA